MSLLWLFLCEKQMIHGVAESTERVVNEHKGGKSREHDGDQREGG